MEADTDPSIPDRNPEVDSGEDVDPALNQSPRNLEHEQDVFDSGTYSESGGAGAGNTTAPVTITETEDSDTPGDIDALYTSAQGSPIFPLTSPKVKRRSSCHNEFKAEEYLYSPSNRTVFNDAPLAASTPVRKSCSVVASSSLPVSSYLQSLLQNFNSLYEEKLAEVDMQKENSNSLQVISFRIIFFWFWIV